ncbi:MAG: response regulator transcription factor [Micropepsaceae bacterium]
MERRVLVIEDDQRTLQHVCEIFREQGWTVTSSDNGSEGLHRALSSPFELVVLDRNLPGLDGLSALKAMKAAGSKTPVIILSALAHVDERVKGLKSGGDDYIVKPFNAAELVARADVLLRKHSGVPKTTTLVCGDLQMDLLTRTVSREGRAIELLPREFKLLEYLIRHKGQTVTRAMLLQNVWDYQNDPHTNIIDTHVSRLRKKLDGEFEAPMLLTVRGIGFCLSADS